MFNKKTIGVITTIIIIGIGLTTVDLFSNLDSQSEQIKESSQSEDSQVIKITGKYAEAICNVIETSCPESAEFDGSDGPNNSLEYKYASKKSIYHFRILDQQLEFMGKKFVDGEWQVVADEWTVLIRGDEPPSVEEFSEASLSGNDYDDGLKINFVERREMYLNNPTSGYGKYHTTEVDKNPLYTIVGEIQNMDGIEKDFFYDVVFTASNGDYEKFTEKVTLLPFDSIQIDSGSTMSSSGKYTVDVYLYEHPNVRDQAVPFSQVWILEEKENED